MNPDQRDVDEACSLLGMASLPAEELLRPFAVGSKIARVDLAARVLAIVRSEAEARGAARERAAFVVAVSDHLQGRFTFWKQPLHSLRGWLELRGEHIEADSEARKGAGKWVR